MLYYNLTTSIHYEKATFTINTYPTVFWHELNQIYLYSLHHIQYISVLVFSIHIKSAITPVDLNAHVHSYQYWHNSAVVAVINLSPSRKYLRSLQYFTDQLQLFHLPSASCSICIVSVSWIWFITPSAFVLLGQISWTLLLFN